MRLLFDLGHPVDYYLFKNVMKKLHERGDEILITVRNREGVVTDILRQEGEKFVFLGENVKGLVHKAIYMIRNDLVLLRIARKFKADIFVSLGSPYSGHVSFLMHKPHISFDDTEISWIDSLLLVPPFTTTVISPTSISWKITFKNYTYIDGTKELAYLTPKYFLPDPEVLREVNVKRGEKIVIIRFSAHDSHHDIGLKDLTNESKKRLVLELSKLARVFISTEVPVEPELQPFVLRIKKMHDLLSQASLFVGEGASMASEAAVLGVPTVFIHLKNFGYIEDHKKFGLVVQYRDPENELDQMIAYCRKILTDEKSKEHFAELRDKMLEKKEDIVLRIIDEIDRHRPEGV